MTVIDGYFYMFDEQWDSLIQKLDDGTVSFTYPLDTLISNPIKSLEFDGINFWTLEGSVVVRKWKI